jgi:4-hydroxybenzoate-CoA ligase
MTALRDYNAAVDFVDRNVAEGRGEKTAFIDPSRNLTYGELRDAAARIGPMLARMGIEPENRIALVLLDTVDFPILFWGAIRAGIVPVLVNTRLTVDQYHYLFEDSRAKAIFVSTALLPIVQEAAKDLPNLRGIVVVGGGPTSVPRLDMLLAAENEGSAPARTAGDEVAYWLYSSGTTGMPKGVMLSHRACLYVASSPGAQRRPTTEDLVYCTLPIAHIFGLTSTWLRGLYGGAHVMLLPRFSAEHLADALERGVTIFQGVPQMYAKLLEYARASGRKLKAPALRMATVGGAPIEPELKEAVEQALGLRLVNGWGMTEFASTVSRSLPQHVGRDISAGPVLPGIEVRIVDENGRDVPKGRAGEIWLRGPNCMLGYYKNPEATRAVLTEDGWYRTGDLGSLAADDTLTIVDRIRDLIIVSGFNVYPAEVEAELTAHPAVTLAAVIGRRRQGNEEVIAFVQLAPGARVTEAELAKFLEPRLAPYKRPARIVVLEQLPAAPTGKIMKAQLKSTAESL